MGGLAVFSLIGLYIFAGYKFVKAIRPGYRKWLAIAVLALIPTADAVLGRIYLKHLCATESGLKVYRVAQGVEGFMSDAGEHGMFVEKHGYKFSEGPPIDGWVKRYSKNDGQVIKENKVIPQSKFRVRLLTTGRKDIYIRSTRVVETFPVREVLATETQIGFNGGWAERYFGGFSDAGAATVAWCREKDSFLRYEELVISTLKH